MFEVGDIVIGNKAAGDRYSITGTGVFGKVVDKGSGNPGTYDIKIAIVPGGTFWVSNDCFNIVKPKNHKFKVGDEVKLSPFVEPNETYDGLCLYGSMIFPDTRTIESISSDGNYLIGRFYYNDEMLIPAKAVAEDKKDEPDEGPVRLFKAGSWVTVSDGQGNSKKFMVRPSSGIHLLMLDDDPGIHIGDTVKVIRPGLSYTTALKWLNEILDTLPIDSQKRTEYIFRFCYGSIPDTDYHYTVLGKSDKKGTGRSCDLIYLIESPAGALYVIGSEGIEQKEEKVGGF